MGPFWINENLVADTPNPTKLISVATTTNPIINCYDLSYLTWDCFYRYKPLTSVHTFMATINAEYDYTFNELLRLDP